MTRFQLRTWEVNNPAAHQSFSGEVKDNETGQVHSLPYNYPTRKEARQEAEALKSNLESEAHALDSKRRHRADTVAQLRAELLAAPKDSWRRAAMNDRLRVAEDKLVALFDGDVEAALKAEDAAKRGVEYTLEHYSTIQPLEFTRRPDTERGGCNLCPYITGGRGEDVTEVVIRSGPGQAGGYAILYCDKHLGEAAQAFQRAVERLDAAEAAKEGGDA
jgi:hypothetical protein